jgi:hypothetical protein
MSQNLLINFKQEVDTTSKPTGNAKGGVVKMIIEVSQNCFIFLAWMV